MDRRKAMAVAGASTAVLASVAVAYAATMSVGWLGFGSHMAPKRITNAAQVVPTDPTTTTVAVEPEVVVEQRDVFDRQVVVVPTTDAPAAPPVASGESDDEAPAAAPASAATASATREAEHQDGAESESVSTSSSAAPPGCVGGVLEDDGVWNCQH